MAEQLLAHLMEGWDDDVRLPEVPDLRKLKILCSEVRNLRPLTSLCLRSVAFNMDKIWCKDYLDNWSTQDVAFLLGPFDDLPGSLVTAIMQTLKEMNMLHVRFLLPLITFHIESIDLSNFKGINKVLVAIKLRCHKVLKALNLEQCKGLSMPALKDTLSTLSNLQILNLRHVGVGDDVLATLGSNNEQLSELYLCYNLKISNAGVKSLCVDDGHVGKCKKLSILTLEFTKVDKTGLLYALENLPKLVILEHSSVSEAGLTWFHNNMDSTLQLQRMSFDMSSVHDTELTELVTACPNLHELEFQCQPIGTSGVDISPFLSMKLLSKFKSENSVIPQISWFIHLGKSLTELSLVGQDFSDEIDLTIIGKSCPNLEKLNIQEILLLESEFYDDADQFKKLKSVLLNNEKQAYSLGRNLTCILSSEHLQSFKFANFQFSDELFSSILHKASTNRKIFSRLHDLEFIQCNSITVQILRTLLCFSPRLVTICLNHCEKITLIDASALEAFIAANKLGTQVIWA